MAAQRKYSPRPILGKGEDLATALHQEVQAISNALTSLGQDLKNAEREFKDETDKAIASVIERFKTEITEINGRVISIAEWSIEMTNEIKGYARIDALNALRSRIEQQGDEVLSYAQYIVALNNTVNGKADVHVVLRLENLIQSFGDQILAYGGIIQEIQIEVAGKASAFALEALESIVTQLGSDLSSMSTAVTALRNDIISAGVPNRLANSEFQDWPPWVFEQAANTTGYELKVANEGQQEWSLNSDTIRTGLIHKPSSPYTSINNWAQLRQGTILVEPGQYYQASIYMSAHRCSGQIIVEFLNGAGVVVSGTTLYSNTVTTAGALQTGGKTLDSYTRAYVFGVAPATAKYARVLVRSTPLTTTVPHSSLFFTCPLFGKALEGQTSPSPYTAGNAGAFASATRTLKSIVEQQGEDLFALAEDVTELSTGVKNPKPGQNMLVDPVFQITREGAWKTEAVGPWLYGVNNGEDWTLVTDGGENTPFIFAPDTYTASAGEYGDLLQENIPVVPGQRYQISCYMGAHRCEGLLVLQFFGPTGTTPLAGGITSSLLTQPVAVTYAGGRALGSYFRVGGFVSAPSGAARATLRIRARWRGPLPSSVPYPYLYIARPFMGTAAEEQTEYSDWAPGAPGNMFAHLRAKGMVWADSTGEGTVGASYELKLRAQDNTGAASAGFGITTAKINGVWRSQIDVTAERFRILNSSTGATSVPFQVVGGVTYIKSAFIQNATITNAHIANLAVTDAKIANLSVGKLTGGNIAANQYIKSSNFDWSNDWTSRQGFFLGADGYVEFGSASIRGQLTAGQITDLSIGPNKIINDSTMIMVTTSRTNNGHIDIGFNAGAGGEDRVRKYAVFVTYRHPKGTVISSLVLPLVLRVVLRMEWNGSNFFDENVTIEPVPVDPYNGVGFTPSVHTTVSRTYDVESTWGVWAGYGWRNIRVELSGAVSQSAYVNLVVLGYKK